MSNEGKKLLMILGGFAGIAVIVVLTAFAMKLIFSSSETQKMPTVDPVVAPQPAPVVQVAPTAQVTSVKPHYVSSSSPKRQCREVAHTVYVAQKSSAPGAGAVLGGVTGGLLGSQVGGGNGRIVTSAAGAAIGALAGNSVQNSMNSAQPHTVYSTVCSTNNVKSSVQKGYEVTYTYEGKQGVVIMDNPPMIGSALPLPLS